MATYSTRICHQMDYYDNSYYSVYPADSQNMEGKKHLYIFYYKSIFIFKLWVEL